MQIRILAVGKLKSRYYQEASDEYEKRILRFARLSVEEVRKTEDLLKHIKKDEQCILLDEHGHEYTTSVFSQFLKKNESHKIVFVIGDTDGLPANLKEIYPCMSLSQGTMTHELARVVLLEQIYRALTVLNNHPYHRA
jgi:23S rRNA (pseudouridine1915-N3)-methyltransferase